MEPEHPATNVVHTDNVAHADHVDSAITAEVATVVTHANNVGLVEVHGESLRSTRERYLRLVREIFRLLTVMCALIVMFVVIIDKNLNENELRDQLTKNQTARAAADQIVSDKLECNRRFQDAIDHNTENQLILIGEFLVTITQIPPGPEREASVQDKIAALAATNLDAHVNVDAKITYNNAGDPLPCPIPASLTETPTTTVAG